MLRSLALHRALFDAQSNALRELGVPRDDAYARRHRGQVQKRARRLSDAAFTTRVNAADVVFVGDHRLLRSSQRWFLELVRRAPRWRPLVIGLAHIPAARQSVIDTFLNDCLSEAVLRSSLFADDLNGHLAWEATASILRYAHQHRCPVVCLGPKTSTSDAGTDARIASNLCDAMAGRPTARFLVLAGEHRVGPAHLPRALKRQAPRRSVVSVLQNAEEVFWEHGKPDSGAHAFELSPDLLCLVHSSPTLGLQGQLDALELELAPGDALLVDTPAEAFAQLARAIASALAVNVESALTRTRVLTHDDLDLSFEHPAAHRQLRHTVLARESAYFPTQRTAYLGSHRLNAAAEEAAHFVRHCAAGGALEKPRRGADAFYARCMEEALAFFGSRRANPVRPYPAISDWVAMLRPNEPLADAAAFVLAHRAAERGGPKSARRFVTPDGDGGQGDLFHAVTHGLGYLLGGALDEALSEGDLTLNEARALFRDPLLNPEAAYFRWTARLRKETEPRAQANRSRVRA